MVKEFNKSTSVDSGIFDTDESFIEMEAGLKMNIGDAVKEILTEAQNENRLISGLKETSKYLNETENPEHSLFFFIAPSTAGDSLTHMQEVFLQAFCLESDIYIIKVDSAEKLNKILGTKRCDTCALVQRSAVLDIKSNDDEIDLDRFTELENILIDLCEDFWSEPVQPIIRLPEK